MIILKPPDILITLLFLTSPLLIREISSEDIHTNILLRPAKILHDKYYVATNTQVSATAEIFDDKFKTSNMTYQWSTKDGTLVTSWNASQINCTFNKPDEDNFLKLVVDQTNEPNNTGSSRKNIVVRNPVVIADPSGKLFIQHGEMLDITMKWSGTGPFTFCYRICPDAFKRDCDSCTPFFDPNANEIRIERYLRLVGNYTLLFDVDNIASMSEKHYSVRVDSTFKTQKVPYVPIISSISAVLILFSGVALHMKFRKTVDMETADFEFLFAQDEDELLEGDTFCQRIWHLLKKPSTYLP